MNIYKLKNSLEKLEISYNSKVSILKTIYLILTMDQKNIKDISMLLNKLVKPEREVVLNFIKKIKAAYSDILDKAEDQRLEIFCNELLKHILAGTENLFLSEYPTYVLAMIHAELTLKYYFEYLDNHNLNLIWETLNLTIDSRSKEVEKIVKKISKPNISTDQIRRILTNYLEADTDSYFKLERIKEYIRKLPKDDSQISKISLDKIKYVLSELDERKKFMLK